MEYKGRILVAEIEMTVVDGTSEAESEGMIDINDCPPIDTWFYKGRNKHGRILFAWIPQQYVDLINVAIDVNCVDCLYWYDKEILLSKDEVEIQELNQKPPKEKTILNSLIKRLFR